MSAIRPSGITIIAVLLAISGLLGIVAFISLLLTTGPAALSTASSVPRVGQFALTTLVLLGVSFLNIVVAWGLWTLKPWALTTTILLQVITVINAAWDATGNGTGTTLINAAISGFILLYLIYDKDVRAAFKR
jgi:hypothetical protein